MNFTTYTSDVTAKITQIDPLSIPHTLWIFYLEYLWFYEPNSWVAKIAYSCRVLAILVSLPVVILGLLDIASYGIARTLGVIDDVKASTSDKATIHTRATSTPVIHVEGVNTPSSDSAFSDSDRDSILDSSLRHRSRSSLADSTITSLSEMRRPSEPSLFYVGDNSLKLSGVGVLSPAASQPPSPTISRHNLALNNTTEHLRHRTQQNTIAE
ncbi:hypothetical protein BDN70DRAFT_991388 [Pholiota conissans]|uniref:Uncharacterized protein n=1 Tax=Pholiota conissans TaxID=109636 RepID=A0A9P5Z7R0_9AGAR|nr:hypothetical protein BDN70DRAFT_991388 [Pholiota conissans]